MKIVLKKVKVKNYGTNCPVCGISLENPGKCYGCGWTAN